MNYDRNIDIVSGPNLQMKQQLSGFFGYWQENFRQHQNSFQQLFKPINICTTIGDADYLFNHPAFTSTGAALMSIENIARNNAMNTILYIKSSFENETWLTEYTPALDVQTE